MQNFAAGDKIAVYNQNFLEEKEEFIIKKVETYDEKPFKLTVEKSAETVKRGFKRRIYKAYIRLLN